jgi:hypothetical protein
MTIQIDGLLPVGLLVDGVVRRKFRLHLARVIDSLQAREQFPEDDLRFRLAHIARRLSLDGVEQTRMTLELVMELYDVDLLAIQEADELLEKKAKPANAD